MIVRYADDFVIGFEHRYEAVACLEALHKQFAKHGLKLHDSKTRLIEFGRFAIERRKARGLGRPATFDFLGFTHLCGVTRSRGWFTVKRISIAHRMRAKLADIKLKLHRRRHRRIGETGRWLKQVVEGWMNYHAVLGNIVRLQQFRDAISTLWLGQIRRRSQRSRWTWDRVQRLVRLHLQKPCILHPYPTTRFRDRLKAGAV